jgi:hypothetical protein
MEACSCCAQARRTEPTPLPYRKPERTWAGYGTGADCDVCHRVIDPSQIEYEVELAASPTPNVLHLHRQCFQQWVAGD